MLFLEKKGVSAILQGPLGISGRQNEEQRHQKVRQV